jgi:hypothetical protein
MELIILKIDMKLSKGQKMLVVRIYLLLLGVSKMLHILLTFAINIKIVMQLLESIRAALNSPLTKAKQNQSSSISKNYKNSSIE